MAVGFLVPSSVLPLLPIIMVVPTFSYLTLLGLDGGLLLMSQILMNVGSSLLL